MSTHPIRYVEQAQCHVCNSSRLQESIEGDIALVSCYCCDVKFKVPIRIVQCEIVPNIPMDENGQAHR